MKLITNILPRRNGTVTAVAGGKDWTFSTDENGEIVGDVDGDEALAELLATGNFQPYDELDLSRAAVLAGADVDPDDGDEEDLDEEDAAGGLPVEAGTRPVSKPGRGRKAR